MKKYDIEDFRECPTCAAKTGSPTLCEICLHNRSVVSNLKAQIKEIRINPNAEYTKRLVRLNHKSEKIIYLVGQLANWIKWFYNNVPMTLSHKEQGLCYLEELENLC